MQDCFVEILNKLHDFDKLKCRLVSTYWNHLICDHCTMNKMIAQVYLDNERRTRFISNFRNISYILPLYIYPIEEAKRGYLLNNKTTAILWIEALSQHTDIKHLRCVKIGLQQAAEAGEINIVKSLITDITIKPTILPFDSIQHVKSKINQILMILINGPRFDFEDIGLKTLRATCELDYLDVAKQLISDYKIDPTYENNILIRTAVANGSINITSYLLTIPEIDPSCMDNYCIISAATNGYHNIVELLMKDSRVSPDANNNEAIQRASGKGHLIVVKLLLRDIRVNPADTGNRAIKNASENGHIEVVKLLLSDPRIDPSSSNNFALRWSLVYDHFSVAKLLLSDKRVIPGDHLTKMIKEKNNVGLNIILDSK